MTPRKWGGGFIARSITVQMHTRQDLPHVRLCSTWDASLRIRSGCATPVYLVLQALALLLDWAIRIENIGWVWGLTRRRFYLLHHIPWWTRAVTTTFWWSVRYRNATRKKFERVTSSDGDYIPLCRTVGSLAPNWWWLPRSRRAIRRDAPFETVGPSSNKRPGQS